MRSEHHSRHEGWEAELAEIKALYASGLTMAEVADRTGRTYAFIYHTLDEAGVPFHRHRKKRPSSPTTGKQPWLRKRGGA